MRFLYCLFIEIVFLKYSYTKIFSGCRFNQIFYQKHPNIFELDNNHTSLTIRALYPLSNQSFSSLSIGIIYHFVDTYLIPVPLLFQCSENKEIFAPIDCEFTIIDTHLNLSIGISESTRITTVPLHFQEYNSLRGAYFKQSTITLKNCRLDKKKNFFISDIFHIKIIFEQKINSPCQNTCIHSQLYQCSSITNTCQCHSDKKGIEIFNHLCIDTELGSNCSLIPERCRRICRTSHKLDPDCQCPLGTQRIFSNNIYQCIVPECNDNKRCIKILNLSLSFLLIALLIGAFFIIIILIIGLIKMRSIRCITFVHPHVLSTNKICEKYTKINLLE